MISESKVVRRACDGCLENLNKSTGWRRERDFNGRMRAHRESMGITGRERRSKVSRVYIRDMAGR